MNRLDYGSKKMEKFAITIISKSFDNSYDNYLWHDKDDDFDFTNPNGTIALEVATIIPLNEINAIQYEKALDKGKTPDVTKVDWAHIDKDCELIAYYGGSADEIRASVLSMINKKEEKRIKRLKKYIRYELCLCIDEGALFNMPDNFNFIVESGVLKTTGFSRLFLITCSNFYVIENNIIQEYKRVIQ